MKVPTLADLDHPLPFALFTTMTVVALIALGTVAFKSLGLPGPVALMEHA